MFYSIIFPSFIYRTKPEWSLAWLARLGIVLTGIICLQISMSVAFIRCYDLVKTDPFNVNEFRRWIWKQFNFKHAESHTFWGDLEVLCWFTYKFTPPMVAILLRREGHAKHGKFGKSRERRAYLWSIILATLYSLCLGLGVSLPPAGKCILLELICLRFLWKASTRLQPIG